jgi:nucleoside-diphosphate-sugar epimerase
MKRNGCAVIFGGTGFIGSFYARHLLDNSRVNKVYVVDNEPLDQKRSAFRKLLVGDDSRINYIHGDVRRPLCWFAPPESIELIANFAAIHREPGHEPAEYFTTNINGAQNVCDWADAVGCSTMVFTSSISPYGRGEEPKDEETLTVPLTPYGSSKLVAEKIHQLWRAADVANRRLVIVRPGVVFGPGEGGNVSRMIKAIRGNYFFYMGNRTTRKAGIYVKELCRMIDWAVHDKAETDGYVLFNATLAPCPSVEEYVSAICGAFGFKKRTVASVPYSGIRIASQLIETLMRPLKIAHPFSPVRVEKLVNSNNIIPKYLTKNGYRYKYDLNSSFVDWKATSPEDWQ